MEELLKAVDVIGPIYGAQISLLIRDDHHLTDGSVESICQELQRVRHVLARCGGFEWRWRPIDAVQRRRAMAATFRRDAEDFSELLAFHLPSPHHVADRCLMRGRRPS